MACYLNFTVTRTLVSISSFTADGTNSAVTFSETHTRKNVIGKAI